MQTVYIIKNRESTPDDQSEVLSLSLIFKEFHHDISHIHAASPLPLHPPRLKRIAADLGVTPAGDKRGADTWINAIITHQSTQLQKKAGGQGAGTEEDKEQGEGSRGENSSYSRDEQTIPQAELNDRLATQANAIATEELRTVEISFYDHEIYCGEELIATITHDHADFVTQRWVVMVNGVEKFRANAWAKCNRYITWHHKQGTLNEPSPTPPEQEATVQGAGCKGEQQYAAPVQEEEELATTGNEIMSQIFHACEQHGLELLDDGIYRDNVKLGNVDCTDGVWWYIRVGELQERVTCDSVGDAVGSLLEPADCEELLDRPFEQLTADEWRKLGSYEAVAA